MQRFSLMLAAAPIALAGLAAPAFAQDQDGDAKARATDESSAPSETKDTASQDLTPEEIENLIVVSGLRKSLETSQAIKRDSDAIVDAIVAQDIGKLPDDTAAESIARIAGVQVTRYGDEANGVLIRGLPDIATSYNGREIFTAELRRVQLQDFPAQALAGIEVYKSGTADIIEPGLAGLVNVRTRRPFDFKRMVLAGGLRGTYNDQSRKFDPSGNILFSDRWQLGDGEIGILLNATFAQSTYYNGVRYNNQSITTVSPESQVTPDGLGEFVFPYSVGLYNAGGTRRRPSGNFSVQWAPTSTFEMYVDGIFQGYRGQGYADNFNIDLRGYGDTIPQYDDVVLLEGTNQVKSFTKSGGYPPEIYRSTGKDSTNTYQLAVGAKWETGRATISTDFAWTTSRYTARNWSLDSILDEAPTVQVDFDKDGGAAFSLVDYDIQDPSHYYWRGYYERLYKASGSGIQWRTDIDLDTGWDFLPKLETGFRLTDRDAALTQGSRYGWTVPLEVPLTDLPSGALSLTADPFRGGAQGFTQYLAPARGNIVNAHAALRQYTYEALQQLVAANPDDQGYLDAMEAFSTEQVTLDPANRFDATEASYAAYLQGKYRFHLGLVDVDGVIGLRAVNTAGRYSGTSNICVPNADDDDCTVVKTPRSTKQNYMDFLPNASMRIKLTPELQLRLGYTKTRTRPDFSALNPALFITQNRLDPTAPVDPSLPAEPNAYGSGGNPDLKPLTSTNYDVSLEYYFSKTGFVSAAVFYRKLFGFINNYTRRIEDPAYGLLEISQPLNAGQGRIKGFELNAQTFFDFLPAPFDGLGVQGNMTYLDGKNRLPVYDADAASFTYDGPFVTIPNVSKWTYNAAIFFEKYGVTSRLSYNRRSDWVNYYRQDADNGQFTGVSTRARDRLDVSVSYDLNSRFTVTADVSNILAHPFRNYNQYAYGAYYPVDVRDEGRYFGFGLRFKFGE
ncbi:TonB-dependent receptor [Novosphingobium sp. 1949]|uniref:TonB-dependent receptor n=1 Tax=Novosphingobium organovorum TaxID=2930092 RepID=A0ABT0B872_9SPHN|nr:TonB-dependent receptor [Novosphingobium organovorum]MCJ2181272.1 TonB-dependent receptor [Novosphingobium organovorum]